MGTSGYGITHCGENSKKIGDAWRFQCVLKLHVGFVEIDGLGIKRWFHIRVVVGCTIENNDSKCWEVQKRLDPLDHLNLCVVGVVLLDQLYYCFYLMMIRKTKIRMEHHILKTFVLWNYHQLCTIKMLFVVIIP